MLGVLFGGLCDLDIRNGVILLLQIRLFEYPLVVCVGYCW